MKESLLIKYNSKYKETLHRLVIENIETKYPCCILDLGCGKGNDLKKLSFINKGKRIYGIDISLSSLKVAASNLNGKENICLLQAKGERLPFRKDSFDIVISSEVIEHIEEAENFINGVYRVLKSRGVFIVTTPSRFNYVTLIGKLVPTRFKKVLRKFTYYLDPGKDINPHVHEYTPKELRKLFQDRGFIIERIESGVLRVPVWPLFDRFSFLILAWKILDRFIDILPLGIYLKFNFVMMGRKNI